MLKDALIKTMTKVYKTIQGVQYLCWKGYYWIAIKEFNCSGCQKKLTHYKKYRNWKGELQELKQGCRYCPECTVSY